MPNLRVHYIDHDTAHVLMVDDESLNLVML